MLPDFVKRGGRHPVCADCPVHPDLEKPFEKCPFHNEFVVDCGDDPSLPIAELATTDASYLYAKIHSYIRATFSINMSLQFKGLTSRQNTSDVDEALSAIKDRGVEFDTRFKLRQEDLLSYLTDEQRTMIDPILSLDLPPFENFIELITHFRSSFLNHYHRQLLDSMFQRSKNTGLIWASKARNSTRRFWMSSRLLETMVQLAVLKNDTEAVTPFYSEPIIIEEFLGWIKNRYGFIVNGIGHERFESSDLSIHNAFKQNVESIKRRLREIGFFNVLSDAYIMQRIRPRYEINKAS